MVFLGLAAAAVPAVPPESWSCSNPVEVSCSGEECMTAEPGGFTPMSVSMSAGGGFSVCAYTGCWEGAGPPLRLNGRLLWTGDGLAFSTSPDSGMKADVTLLLIEAERIGFVRAAGFASPLLCEPRGEWPEEPSPESGGESEEEARE